MKARVAFRFIVACILMSGFLSNPLQAGITVADLNSTYTQDFNTLVTAGPNNWLNDSDPNRTLPGWSLFTNSGNPISSYTLGTGSVNTGGIYSFGSVSSPSDRALGSVGSNGFPGAYISVQFINGSGTTLDAFSLSFTGEQWRNGGNTTAQTMVFQYGFGTAFSDVSSWVTPGGGFNFLSPIATATASALDGNAAANRSVGLGGTISGLNWNDGQSLWLRWIEANDAGNDHGLAIDDLSFSVTAVPEPGSMLLLGCVGLAGGMWRLRKRVQQR